VETLGTQFVCFTGTTAQVLTQKALLVVAPSTLMAKPGSRLMTYCEGLMIVLCVASDDGRLNVSMSAYQQLVKQVSMSEAVLCRASNANSRHQQHI